MSFETSLNAPNWANALTASDMLDAQAQIAALINDPAFTNVTLDPLTIYCTRTGQPIGQRLAEPVMAAIQFHGKAAYIESSVRSYGLNTAPAWVSAGPEALDKLIEADPIAYAAFALGVIVSKYSAKPAKYDAGQMIAQHYQLARAYSIIRQSAGNEQRKHDVVELNYTFCELLAYGEQTVKHIVGKLGASALRADSMALLAVSGELQPVLTNAIEETLKAFSSFEYVAKSHKTQRFESIARSPADAARGPSNIKGQSRNKARIANRMKVLNLMREFGDLGFGQSLASPIKPEVKPSKSGMPDLYSRVMQQAQRHDPILDRLAETDFEKWAEIDLGDLSENAVEVRTISHAAADMMLDVDAIPDLAEAVTLEPLPVSSNPLAKLASLVAAQAPKEEPKPVAAPKFGNLMAQIGKRGRV